SGTTIPRLIGFVPGGGKTPSPACSPGSSNVYVGSPCAFGAGAGGVPGVADGCFSMTDGGGGGGFGASGRARGSSTTRLSGGGSAGARAITGRRPERRMTQPATPRKTSVAASARPTARAARVYVIVT